MFDEYLELFSKIQELKSEDLIEAEQNLKLLKQQLNDIDSEINKLKQESNDKNSPIIKKYLSEEAAKIESENRKKLAAIANKENNISTDNSKKRANEISAIKNDYEEETTLKYAYKVITDNDSKYNTSSIGNLSIPIEPIASLNKRAKLFEKHNKIVIKSNRLLCEKVADRISLKDIFIGITNTKVAVSLMTCYILGLAIASIYMPIIALSLYTCVTVISIKDALSEQDLIKEMQEELWLLKSSYNNLESIFKKKYQDKIDEINNRLDAEYEESLKELIEEKNKLKKEYEKLLSDLNEMENNPDFIASKLSIFIHKLENMEEERKDYLDEIKDAESEYNDIKSLLSEYEDELQSLRKKIEDKYCGMLEPGTERLLPSSLFLGFETNGNLKLFEYNLNSTLIVYSGEINDASNLALLIFLELLRETNITALNFVIMETQLGASQFAPFTQEDLAEAVTLCTVKEQCINKINDIYDIFTERGTSILSSFSDIQEFNKAMIAKNSLTKEYVILIVIDSNGAIINNQKFNQLLMNGPQRGIIPFVFMPVKKFSNLFNGIIDKIQPYYDLLSSIEKSWFSYQSDKEALFKNDEAYIKSNIHRLSMNISERK